MTGFSQPERRGLERLQRLQTAQAHPDADLLTAFSEQALTAREREQVLTHLAVCPTCREVVSLAGSQVSELPLPQAETQPAFWKWPVLRWGAVAASAVIVVVAVSIGHQENKDTQTAQITTETAPVAVPATAEKKTLNDEVAQVPASAGLKAPQIRYEKITPKADKDVLDKAVGQASDRERQTLKKETNAPLAAGAMVANVTAPPMATDSVSAAKVGESTSGTSLPLGENELQMSAGRAAPGPPPVPGTMGKTASARVSAPESAEVTSQVMVAGAATATASPQSAPKTKQNDFHGALQKTEVARKDEEKSAASRDLRYQSLGQQWQVTSEGYLLNSADQGKTWARQLPDQRFTHVQTVGNHVWACGPDGVLMHSIDGGTNWTRVVPADHDAKLKGEITSIVFTDVNHGTLKTSSGEKWSTEDAGLTWRKSQ
jgi:hypothetical protein